MFYRFSTDNASSVFNCEATCYSNPRVTTVNRLLFQVTRSRAIKIIFNLIYLLYMVHRNLFVFTLTALFFSVLSYLLTYLAHRVVTYRNSMPVDIVTLNYFPQICDAVVLSERMSTCADEVLSWMRTNQLQANTSKTEILWCWSGRRQHQIPTTSV